MVGKLPHQALQVPPPLTSKILLFPQMPGHFGALSKNKHNANVLAKSIFLYFLSSCCLGEMAPLLQQQTVEQAMPSKGRTFRFFTGNVLIKDVRSIRKVGGGLLFKEASKQRFYKVKKTCFKEDPNKGSREVENNYFWRPSYNNIDIIFWLSCEQCDREVSKALWQNEKTRSATSEASRKSLAAMPLILNNSEYFLQSFSLQSFKTLYNFLGMILSVLLIASLKLETSRGLLTLKALGKFATTPTFRWP